jgi:TolB-like protein/Flp pilus assembly protein TadD
MVEGEQIYGAGVNVAARLETLAEPGGICISDVVHGQVRSKLALHYQDLGEQHVKNIAEPVRVLRVLIDGTISAAIPAKTVAVAKRHMLLGTIGVLLVATIIYGIVKGIAEQWSVNARVIRSIAVLPLDNFSGDPNQEYFVDGMTDELTTDLATISQLRVISRGSVMRFKGEHRLSTPEIAKLLNVDAVIEGSVLRVGDRVRITAQLIDAPADQHLWAKSFERNSRDVLMLQDEMASAIAKEIEVQLTPSERIRLARARTVIPAAHDAYLKGRYFISRPSDENVTKAIAQFEQAIKLEPNFALAYSGLSDAYNWAGTNETLFTAAAMMTKSKAAAQRAVLLDDNSAEAHASLALYLFSYEFDWPGAEREFQRAIELNPSYAFAHDVFGFALAQQGELKRASAESKRAVELDPLSSEVLAMSAWASAWRGKYRKAKEMAQKALDLDETSTFAQFMIGWTDIEAGEFSSAIPELQKAAAMKAPPYVNGYLGYAYGESGDRAHAAAEIDALNKRALDGYVAPFNLAIIYLGLGDHQRALSRLDEAYVAHSQLLGLLKMDRIFDPLRPDPRFTALLRKVGLDK